MSRAWARLCQMRLGHPQSLLDGASHPVPRMLFCQRLCILPFCPRSWAHLQPMSRQSIKCALGHFVSGPSWARQAQHQWLAGLRSWPSTMLPSDGKPTAAPEMLPARTSKAVQWWSKAVQWWRRWPFCPSQQAAALRRLTIKAANVMGCARLG